MFNVPTNTKTQTGDLFKKTDFFTNRRQTFTSDLFLSSFCQSLGLAFCSTMAPSVNRVMNFILILAMAMAPLLSQAVDIHQVRQMAAKFNVTCMLVFGDSSVDPGNNNWLLTPMKGDFLPYGKDFFEGKPTGRFSNGRLPTDFIGNIFKFYRHL